MNVKLVLILVMAFVSPLAFSAEPDEKENSDHSVELEVQVEQLQTEVEALTKQMEWLLNRVMVLERNLKPRVIPLEG